MSFLTTLIYFKKYNVKGDPISVIFYSCNFDSGKATFYVTGSASALILKSISQTAATCVVVIVVFLAVSSDLILHIFIPLGHNREGFLQGLKWDYHDIT